MFLLLLFVCLFFKSLLLSFLPFSVAHGGYSTAKFLLELQRKITNEKEILTQGLCEDDNCRTFPSQKHKGRAEAWKAFQREEQFSIQRYKLY